MALMIECGVAPKEATKKTHSQVHKAGKVLLLAISYGAGPAFVAGRLGVSLWEGEDILHRLQKAFPVFFQWREEVLLKARWQKFIETPDGWRQSIDSKSNPRSIYNYPMQATGAAMTRCAAILAAKAGLRVLVTVHDALLVEADQADADARNRLQEAMAAGANLLAPDYGIRHEVESVAYPARYAPDDPPARRFWNKVMRVVAVEEGRDPESWTMRE